MKTFLEMYRQDKKDADVSVFFLCSFCITPNGEKMISKLFPIYKTAMGYTVFVKKGKKSEFDFRVKYSLSDKKLITPRYIYFAFDFYVKMSGNKLLTIDLINHFIGMSAKFPQEKEFPPDLLFLSHSTITKYSPLDSYGEYSAEFLLAIFELFLRQKKQEFPNSTKSIKFLHVLQHQDDIYTICQTSL